jgi:hypothetical protein
VFDVDWGGFITSSVDHVCFWWVRRVCWGARVMDANILGTPSGSAPDNFVRCNFCSSSRKRTPSSLCGGKRMLKDAQQSFSRTSPGNHPLLRASQSLHNSNLRHILIYPQLPQPLHPLRRQLINFRQPSRTPRLSIHQLDQSRRRRKDTHRTTVYLVSPAFPLRSVIA